MGDGMELLSIFWQNPWGGRGGVQRWYVVLQAFVAGERWRSIGSAVTDWVYIYIYIHVHTSLLKV